MREVLQSAFRRHRLLVLLLLLAGAALRLVAPGDVPPGLYHDEAQHGLDALAVLESGELPLYFAANNGREPLYIYLVTAAVGLLGRSPLAVRLPAFFAGFLTLAATYDLARVLLGRRVGLWALGVLAVTLWHVHLSRVGFRAVLLPLFTALFLAQAARAIKHGRVGHWLAAGALYGAGWYTYTGVRFTPVALAAIVLYGLLCHRERTLRLWRGALLFCGAALVVLAPLGLYTLRYPDVVLQRAGQVSVFSPEISGGDPWGTLLRHLWRTGLMFFVRGDRIWRHNLAWRPVWDPALGLAFVIGLGVALGGIFNAKAQRRQEEGARGGEREDALPFAVILVWTGVMLVPTVLAEDAPHFLRAVGVLPVVALLPALGLAWIADRAGRLLPHVSRFTLPALLLLFGLGATTYDYFVRYAQAPLAYHWFEAGPVALAGQINALRGEGWDGERMLHGPPTGRAIYVDPLYWLEWEAVPFLVPTEEVTFLPVGESPPLGEGLAFFVWPYRGGPEQALSHLPHPAVLRATRGPEAQGDKEPEPYAIALLLRADPAPEELPPPLARFERGVTLRGVSVEPQPEGARVLLTWGAEESFDVAHTVFVHYLRGGERLAQHDGPPGWGYLQTTIWQPGDVVLDEHLLEGVDVNEMEGVLRIGLYNANSGEGLSLLDAAGNPAGQWVDVPVSPLP
ncbi:MAG: ArnT family glycosyltransferase [Anaerolineales bacterium]